jgi:hypothetical protein
MQPDLVTSRIEKYPVKGAGLNFISNITSKHILVASTVQRLNKTGFPTYGSINFTTTKISQPTLIFRRKNITL